MGQRLIHQTEKNGTGGIKAVEKNKQKPMVLPSKRNFPTRKGGPSAFGDVLREGGNIGKRRPYSRGEGGGAKQLPAGKIMFGRK